MQYYISQLSLVSWKASKLFPVILKKAIEALCVIRLQHKFEETLVLELGLVCFGFFVLFVCLFACFSWVWLIVRFLWKRSLSDHALFHALHFLVILNLLISSSQM